MPDDDLTRVGHMLDSAESVQSFVTGRTRKDLDHDQMLLFALSGSGRASMRVSYLAITCHECVGNALERLKVGLAQFVWRKMAVQFGRDWPFDVREVGSDIHLRNNNADVLGHVAVQVVVVDRK